MITEAEANNELDGIWFLSTFLDLGGRYIVDPAAVSFVPTEDDGHGFSQVVVELESGEKWRIEVEKVPS